jgi:uncharacterized protein YndB with AHSA1/START domain
MVARPRGVDDARMHQRGATGRHDPLRMDGRQRGRIPSDGRYLELEPHSRIVHVERMHLPDSTPDNHVETRFDRDGAGTLLTMRMTLPNAQTREAMLATGMERGMEASYVRLEGMI